MSELQLGLIVIGVAIVAGVYAFNRWQERQFRRRVEYGTRNRLPDLATNEEAQATEPSERIEPKLSRGADPSPLESSGRNGSGGESPEMPAATALVSEEPSDAIESSIDYLCTIRSEAAIPYELVSEFFRSAISIGKRVALKAWAADSREWLELPLAEPRPVTRLAASLQLADRAGPLNRVQLSTMRDLVQSLAERTGALCECPEIDAAARAAAELDRFCAGVDISIGCNVTPSAGGGLPGTKVRGLLESSGYVLEAAGRYVLHAEDGRILLSASDSQGGPLTAERLRTESLAGLTLAMDVPNVPANGRMFDRMIETARHLAQALDAEVVDDNRTPLTEPGLNVIRQQLRAVQASMQARGIAAGSEAAARLFS